MPPEHARAAQLTCCTSTHVGGKYRRGYAAQRQPVSQPGRQQTAQDVHEGLQVKARVCAARLRDPVSAAYAEL